MNKYELLNQIGDGTFGSVAKAVNKKTGQLVAIKKMKQKYYTWEQCVKLPEVDIVRRIHGHPNVVKLREVIRENNELFFVFECMDEDLLGVIKKAKQAQSPQDCWKSPALPLPKVKSFMRQVLQALAYIHKRGYFHRDLKPENLLVKREVHNSELLKLADFGLVKETRMRPPFTDYVSTRWYRAPELLLQDRCYGPPVDIWAAGCIMSELLTTRPLFPGTNEVDQLFKIMGVLGSPDEKSWPAGMMLARKIRYTFPAVRGAGLSKVLPSYVPALAIDLMSRMLVYDPKSRYTAEQCLQHPYFKEDMSEVQRPSLVDVSQSAEAAASLSPSPQSSPAALPPNVSGSQKPKDANRTSNEVKFPSAEVPNLPAVSPQKLYVLSALKSGESPYRKGSKLSNAGSPQPVGLSSKPSLSSDASLARLPSLKNNSNITTRQNSTEATPAANALPDVKPAGITGLHLANIRPPVYKRQPAPAVAGPSNVPLAQGRPSVLLRNVKGPKASTAPPPAPPLSTRAEPKVDDDLDTLMKEISDEGPPVPARAERSPHPYDASAVHVSPPPPPGASSSKDRITAMLNANRYRKSTALDNVSAQPGKSANPTHQRTAPLPLSHQSTFTPAVVSHQHAMSPSIKALLTRHRAGHLSALQ